MVLLAGHSLPELLIVPAAGAVAREPVRWAIDALQSRGNSLERYYWEISYAPGDTDWLKPDSIELMRLCRRGKRVHGTIYSVYQRFDHQRRRWSFDGWLIDHGRQLGIVYRSTGEEYGSNGVMVLGPLRRYVWCGPFYERPNPEREAELDRLDQRNPGAKRIGPGVPEESQVELVAADRDSQDPVRRFLASVLDAEEIELIAAELPRRTRRILLEPARPTRRARVWRALISPLPRWLKRRLIGPNLVLAGEWESPSRGILFGDEDEKEEAA